jgi:hypothetical protein
MNSFVYMCVVLNVLHVESSHSKADLSVFGSCVLHIKRFREEAQFLDLTSVVIQDQFTNREYPLFSIYNGSDMTSQIQPARNVHEECSLNVMIGIYPSDADQLYNFMFTSGYTFNSNPRSIFIIVLGSHTRSLYLLWSTVRLPISIFVLNVPSSTDIIDSAGLNTPMDLLYVCIRCGVTREFINKDNIKTIRLISDTTYERKWLNSRLTLQAITSSGGGDITLCETYIWKMWRAPLGHNQRRMYRYCTKSFAFTDLLARSVHPNVTVLVRKTVDILKDRFVGFFNYGFWGLNTEIGPLLTSSVYFHAPGFSSFLYCHNEKHFADITLRSWINCFSPGVWALFFGVMISVQVCIMCLQQAKEQCGFSVICCIRSMLDVFGIIFRQGNCKCVILSIFSLGIMIVLSLFENNLTSYLIAPKVQREHTLADLVVGLGYRVLYDGDSASFKGHLPYLEQLLILNKVPFGANGTLQQVTKAVFTEPNTLPYNKVVYYTVLTRSSKALILQLFQSKFNPSNFSCTVLEYSDRRFQTNSAYSHDMRYKFFYINEILTQAGMDLIFDQDLAVSTPDYAEKTMVHSEHAQTDLFLSLKYLVNFFYFNGVACFTCTIIFMVEACFTQVKQVIIGAIVYCTRCLLVRLG